MILLFMSVWAIVIALNEILFAAQPFSLNSLAAALPHTLMFSAVLSAAVYLAKQKIISALNKGQTIDKRFVAELTPQVGHELNNIRKRLETMDDPSITGGNASSNGQVSNPNSASPGFPSQQEIDVSNQEILQKNKKLYQGLFNKAKEEQSAKDDKDRLKKDSSNNKTSDEQENAQRAQAQNDYIEKKILERNARLKEQETQKLSLENAQTEEVARMLAEEQSSKGKKKRSKLSNLLCPKKADTTSQVVTKNSNKTITSAQAHDPSLEQNKTISSELNVSNNSAQVNHAKIAKEAFNALAINEQQTQPLATTQNSHTSQTKAPQTQMQEPTSHELLAKHQEKLAFIRQQKAEKAAAQALLSQRNKATNVRIIPTRTPTARTFKDVKSQMLAKVQADVQQRTRLNQAKVVSAKAKTSQESNVQVQNTKVQQEQFSNIKAPAKAPAKALDQALDQALSQVPANANVQRHSQMHSMLDEKTKAQVHAKLVAQNPAPSILAKHQVAIEQKQATKNNHISADMPNIKLKPKVSLNPQHMQGRMQSNERLFDKRTNLDTSALQKGIKVKEGAGLDTSALRKATLKTVRRDIQNSAHVTFPVNQSQNAQSRVAKPNVSKTVIGTKGQLSDEAKARLIKMQAQGRSPQHSKALKEAIDKAGLVYEKDPVSGVRPNQGKKSDGVE